MNCVDRKLIDAVIAKAERVCPGSLELIGVYGSAATGDRHDKSDLDLMLLIRDDAGWKLASGFILTDRGVGYDLYCTDWNSLKRDAECHHAQLSKLLDSKIVWIGRQKAYEELCGLREKASAFLKSDERFRRVSELIDKAKVCYANACLSETPGQVRVEGLGVIYYLMDAMMLYHGTYFRLGVKRALDELKLLPSGEEFAALLEELTSGTERAQMLAVLKKILRYVQTRTAQKPVKAEPSADLSGTYEEMVSNWRNKVEEAAKNGDCFSSFVNMANFQHMYSAIAETMEIGVCDVMEHFDPKDLDKNLCLYDECLEKYEQIYRQAGIRVKRFANADDFIAHYLSEQ